MGPCTHEEMEEGRCTACGANLLLGKNAQSSPAVLTGQVRVFPETTDEDAD